MLPNLEFLDLSFNELESLEELPSGKITTLNLSNNRLVDIKFEVCDSLHRLDLSNNGIKTIPSRLSSFSSLKVLDLSFNMLDNLQEIHEHLPCKILTSLNLEGNQLNCVSSLIELRNLASLISLSSLNLGGNPLEDFATSRNIEIRPFILFLLPCLRVLNRLDVSDRTRQFFKDETRRTNLLTSMVENRFDSYLASVCMLIDEEEEEEENRVEGDVPSPIENINTSNSSSSNMLASTTQHEETKSKQQKVKKTFLKVPERQFRKLQHHVAEMRRYLRVWIRQERQRRNVAATRVQRWIRGVMTRLHLKKSGVLPFNRHRRGIVLTKREKDEMETKFPGLKDLGLEEPSPEMYASWRRLWIAGEHGNVDDVEMMAMLIQACWRGYSLRRDLRRVLRNEHAATAIQALWRGALRRRVKKNIIQRSKKIILNGAKKNTAAVLQGSSSIQIQKACMNIWEEYGAARLDTADEAIGLIWDEMSSLRKWVEKVDAGSSSSSINGNVLKEKTMNVDGSGNTEVKKLRREVKSLRSEVSDLKDLVNALLVGAAK